MESSTPRLLLRYIRRIMLKKVVNEVKATTFRYYSTGTIHYRTRPNQCWQNMLARQELTAPLVPRAQSGLRSAPAYWLVSLRLVLVQVL